MRISDWSSDVCSSDLLCMRGRDWSEGSIRDLPGCWNATGLQPWPMPWEPKRNDGPTSSCPLPAGAAVSGGPCPGGNGFRIAILPACRSTHIVKPPHHVAGVNEIGRAHV